MNFSTMPPYRPTTVRAWAKYRVSSSRTASGSRDSDNGVKPTTSQNSTEHTRRSATGSAPRPGTTGTAGAVGEAGAISATGEPQARQNRFPGVTSSPHDGHTSTAVPQSPQKRSPSPTDAPHCPQVTPPCLRQRPGPVKASADQPGRMGGRVKGRGYHSPFGQIYDKRRKRHRRAGPGHLRQALT